MSKAEIDALGRVYENEVERSIGPRKHDFPFQSRAAIYKRLVAGGLLESRTVMHGAPPLSVRIEGYELTHAGRMLYCLSCEDDVRPA